MNVFVSYASEHFKKAEAVALKLKTAGHVVFYDKDSLPPGESYDDKIRKSCVRCDLFIFFISPEST